MAKRVLVAEDEPNIVVSLEFLLTRAGFHVDVRSSGAAALEAARTTPPDVMILDIMLPEMNGLEVLRQLRADQVSPHLPVLMLTAKGQREDRDKAIEAGADVFLTKPFANAELVSAVCKLVEDAPAR